MCYNENVCRLVQVMALAEGLLSEEKNTFNIEDKRVLQFAIRDIHSKLLEYKNVEISKHYRNKYDNVLEDLINLYKECNT